MALLPSRLAVEALALDSVARVCRAAGLATAIDPARVAQAYRSERGFRLDGVAPNGWAPLSGFWRTSDGWVRTHGNYPHHAAALRRGLHLADEAGAEQVRDALSSLASARAVSLIASAGGLAVVVRPENPDADAALRTAPLVESRMLGAAVPRNGAEAAPLSGIRVLDLTRVIAGPVCTRTLALLGADVLRIDPPGLPEIDWQHLDTGHGKRSAVLDVRSARFEALLADADVVVLGYRPAALSRLGLSPESIAARHPGVVIAQLCAWGFDQPERRGFDSLVQAESGIALIEAVADGSPGALPAQALDHSAGYLLAAAVCEALAEQRERGGSWLVRTSLRRIAAELLGMPRAPEPEPLSSSDADTQTFVVDGRSVTTARSAVPGFEYAAPRPFGRDAAEW